MNRSHHDRILVVEDDPRTLESLVKGLVGRFDAHITCVSTVRDAIDIDDVEPHAVTIAAVDVPETDGLALAEHFTTAGDCAVILTSASPTMAQVIEALRAGAHDYFVKPFAINALLDSVDQALTARCRQARRERRHRRLRSLVRRVLQERRGLHQRVDLVCRDLVGAHRRLVHRFLQEERPDRIAS